MAPRIAVFGAVFVLLLWSVRQDEVIGWRLRVTAFCLGCFVPYVLPLGFAGTYFHPELQLESYFSVATSAASVLTIVGVVGILRGRTWGLFMFPVAALLPVLWVPEAAWSVGPLYRLGHPLVELRDLNLMSFWVAAHLTVFLLWAGPIVRFLRSEACPERSGRAGCQVEIDDGGAGHPSIALRDASADVLGLRSGIHRGRR